MGDDPHDDWSDSERLAGLRKESSDSTKHSNKRSSWWHEQPNNSSTELGTKEAKQVKRSSTD
tara:strand:- start:124 stop:309 length:186 start_codon:yes stop_codon:yes gene_type:complete